MEIALYLALIRIILLLSDFVNSIDTSRMSELERKKIREKQMIFRVSIAVIIVTMIMSSSYQVFSPWLYISDTYTTNTVKVTLYEWLY